MTNIGYYDNDVYHLRNRKTAPFPVRYRSEPPLKMLALSRYAFDSRFPPMRGSRGWGIMPGR